MNMEKLPSQFESKEEKREKLIEALKERVDAPETRELLLAWVDEEEKIANAEKSAIGRIEMARRMARLYREAGLNEMTVLSLEDAAEQAWQERQDDLYREIMEELRGVR